MIAGAVTLIGLLLLWQFAHTALKVLSKPPKEVDLAPVWAVFDDVRRDAHILATDVAGLNLRTAKLEGEAPEVEIRALGSRISKLQIELERQRDEQAKVYKVAEDAQKLMSQANIGIGFKPFKQRD